MNTFDASRRVFLKSSALAGGGLLVGFSLTAGAVSQEESQHGGFEPNAFVQITPQNDVIFHCPRDEMGQGATTGLGTVIAEELDVDPAALVVKLAGADAVYANPEYGMQITGGSTSIKAHYLPLRQVGANVRQAIIQAAARDLGVPASDISTGEGHVLVNGERHPYGRFAATASANKLPQEAALKSRAAFKYIGKEFPRLDGLEKSTGTAVYGIDVDIPGMHHAVVVHSPVAGGTLKSLNAEQARAMPGVTDVVAISAGVAVVAVQFWQAKKAAKQLQLQWDLPELASVSTPQVKADYQRALAAGDGVATEKEGNLKQGFAAASVVVENEYWAPYLAHAPLEPMNAVVRIEGDEVDVWSGTQSPQTAQGLVARALGMNKGKVRMHSTFMGGGFGRRATLGHVVEAAQIAAATGKPIHLLWTREDDMKHGVYRPASLMRIKAGIDSKGLITAWEATRVGGNNMPTTLSNQLPALLPTLVPNALINLAVGAADKAFADWTVDHSSIEGLYEDYDFPNRKVLHITQDHGLPLTFWRSVGHSYTAFAKETIVDELALSSGLGPAEFRLRNARNNPRLAGVIRIAGERMRALQPAAGRDLGMAAHGSFSSYVAQVAEVSIDNGDIRVHRVLCVVDCGQVVNPDVVRTQMEGAIMFGLTAALHGNLELENGEIRQSNFHDYPILRMNEAPAVEVILVDSEEAPTGVGEPGLPPIAPAVANAVYAATGQRLRALPLQLA